MLTPVVLRIWLNLHGLKLLTRFDLFLLPIQSVHTSADTCTTHISLQHKHRRLWLWQQHNTFKGLVCLDKATEGDVCLTITDVYVTLSGFKLCWSCVVMSQVIVSRFSDINVLVVEMCVTVCFVCLFFMMYSWFAVVYSKLLYLIAFFPS